MSSERDLVRECIPLLQPHGQAVTQYITAGLPGGEYADLVFVPFQGPKADEPLVVEVKYAHEGVVADLLLHSVPRHASKIREANNGRVAFALAVNTELAKHQRDMLADAMVSVFEQVHSGEDLASAVLRWAGLDH